MKEDRETLRAAGAREAVNAPPLTPEQRDVIASAFRGVQSPWLTEKLRGKRGDRS